MKQVVRLEPVAAQELVEKIASPMLVKRQWKNLVNSSFPVVEPVKD